MKVVPVDKKVRVSSLGRDSMRGSTVQDAILYQSPSQIRDVSSPLADAIFSSFSFSACLVIFFPVVGLPLHPFIKNRVSWCVQRTYPPPPITAFSNQSSGAPRPFLKEPFVLLWVHDRRKMFVAFAPNAVMYFASHCLIIQGWHPYVAAGQIPARKTPW